MGDAATFWIVLLLVGWICAVVLYLVALRIGLMALVDTLWTTGLGLGAIAYTLYFGLHSVHGSVILLLIAIWSFRLSYHLFSDRILPGKEDPRYARLATYWGDSARRNFLFLFMGQIPLVAVFLLPVSIALANPVDGFRFVDLLAMLIAIVALGGEALADYQLAKFRAKPENKGGVCQNGLWRYSRHPNYFFEWLHWWAYVCFAIGAQNWWLSLLGPFAMFIFLRFVTGVPPAEKSSLQSRGDAYRRYQKTTNAFFPWRPHVIDS